MRTERQVDYTGPCRPCIKSLCFILHEMGIFLRFLNKERDDLIFSPCPTFYYDNCKHTTKLEEFQSEHLYGYKQILLLSFYHTCFVTYLFTCSSSNLSVFNAIHDLQTPVHLPLINSICILSPKVFGGSFYFDEKLT